MKFVTIKGTTNIKIIFILFVVVKKLNVMKNILLLSPSH